MRSRRWRGVLAVLALALVTTMFQASPAAADAEAPFALACDDGTLVTDGLDGGDAFVEVTLPFSVNVGDSIDGVPTTDDTVIVHEDGAVTFEFPLGPYSKYYDLAELSSGDNEVIAPLYANATGGDVSYGAVSYQGRDAFCVEWTDMEPTNPGVVVLDPVPTNSFQLVIVERADRAAGDFDIVVNYEQLEWDDSYCPGGFGPEFDVEIQQFAQGCCNIEFNEGPCCDIELEEGPCCDFEVDDGLCCELNPELCPIEVGAQRRSVFDQFESAAGLAGVSFPNGVFDSGRVVEFPGSGEIDAMIGATGLAGKTLNSLQPGRFVIEIESGFQQDLGTVVGTVSDEAGGPVSGSLVSLCADAGPANCAFTQTDEAGEYSIGGVPTGDYTVTARAPIGVNLFENSTLVDVIFTTIDNLVGPIVLSGPQPPAPNVNFGPTRSWGSDTTVYWNDDLDLAVTGCVGGTATWTLVASEGPSPLGGDLVEGPDGTYTGVIPALFPTHGNATITTNIDCPDGSAEDTEFTLYIDPAGTVRELHSTDAIDGATVVLERRGAGEIEFTQIPDGSNIMSPSNRVNPFTTGENGLFSWDVIPGEYRVTVSKAGCDSIALPAAWASAVLTEVSQLDGEIDGLLLPPASVTPILQVNPEWLDLDLYLDCNNAPTIEAPGAVTLEGPAGAADLSAPAASDLDPTDVLTVTSDAPAQLVLGANTVTWTVSDGEASASVTQEVTVVDTTAPALAVPAAITVSSADGNPVAVDFDATATDTIDGAVDVTCDPASGQEFAVGTTSVTCAASDNAGNVATDSFDVTVEESVEPPTADIRQTVSEIATALEDVDGLSRGDLRRVKRAKWYLDYSDHNRYWRDDNQVSDRHGYKALTFMRIAVSYLDRMGDERFADENLLLLSQMRDLASTRIDEAIEAGASDYWVGAANHRLDVGDTRRDTDRLGSAGNNYRQAWVNATIGIKRAN